MSELMRASRVLMMVTFGLLAGASCRHNDGSSPASPLNPLGGGTPDGGPATHPERTDPTKTGEPIGPVALASGVPSGARLAANASADGLDGLGGIGGGGSGGPGLGGAPNGGVGAMGGLPQPTPQPTIGH